MVAAPADQIVYAVGSVLALLKGGNEGCPGAGAHAKSEPFFEHTIHARMACHTGVHSTWLMGSARRCERRTTFQPYHKALKQLLCAQHASPRKAHNIPSEYVTLEWRMHAMMRKSTPVVLRKGSHAVLLSGMGPAVGHVEGATHAIPGARTASGLVPMQKPRAEMCRVLCILTWTGSDDAECMALWSMAELYTAAY